MYAVWRVLRREGIYLQRQRSWCVSTDKQFAPKAADGIALYLNPPVHAVVLSVHEKPSVQAIERLTGYVETDIHDKDLSRENTHLLGLIGRISGEATVAGLTVCTDLPNWIR